MFSSLSRLFLSSSQPPVDNPEQSGSSSSHDPAPSRERTTSASTDTRAYPDFYAHGTKGGSTPVLSGKPQIHVLERTRTGPSQVSWITSTATASPSQTPTRSATASPSPSQSLSLSPRPSRPILRSQSTTQSLNTDDSNNDRTPTFANGLLRIPPSSVRMSADSGSLNLQSVYLSDVDSASVISLPVSLNAGGAGNGGATSRPLSPIDEGGGSPGQSQDDHMLSTGSAISNTRRMSAGSDGSHVYTPAQTPTVAHQAFLNRPLKRSLSQTSTSTGTFMTPTSAMPPSATTVTTFGGLPFSASSAHGHAFAHVLSASNTPIRSGLPPSSGHPAIPANIMPDAHGLPAPAQPPFIPPIDLRPSFTSSLPPLASTYGGNRRMQLAAPPSLPTVIGSPHSPTRFLPVHRDVSVIYENDDTVSFVTAPSEHFSESESEYDEEVDLGVPRRRSSSFEDLGYPYARYKGEQYDMDVGESQSHMSLPDGTFDIELGPITDAFPLPPASPPHLYPPSAPHRSPSRTNDASVRDLHHDEHPECDEADEDYGEQLTQVNASNPFATPVDYRSVRTHTSVLTGSGAGSILETISRRSHDTNRTMVERAIDNRWLRGVSWGSFKSFKEKTRRWSQYRKSGLSKFMAGEDDLEANRSKSMKRRLARAVPWTSAPTACILFWMGFIAPWCWLIGGWYLSERSGEVKESEGQFLDTAVLQWPRQQYHVRTTEQKASGRSLRFWRSRKIRAEGSAQPAEKQHSHEDEPVGEPHEDTETTPMTPVETAPAPAPGLAFANGHVHGYANDLHPNRRPPSTPSRQADAQVDKMEVQLIDRWVSRCRIAAVTCGALICVAVVVVVIIIAGVRS